MRDLTHEGFTKSLVGASIQTIERRGKFILFGLSSESPPLLLVLNPKLTGRLQLAAPADKMRPKTLVILEFTNGQQLRYRDQKQMGQLYLAYDLQAIPDFSRMGPEPLNITLQEFRESLKTFSRRDQGSAHPG